MEKIKVFDLVVDILRKMSQASRIFYPPFGNQ